jgi:triacylglycerol lipase
MYYPPDFDRKKAIELCKLVQQAYEQFDAFKQSAPWELQDDYSLVCEIFYHTILSFDAQDESELTAIDREMQNLPVSYSIDSLIGKDVPLGFIATQGKNIYLVFRGTQTPREWMFDVNIKMVPYQGTKWGKVSNGFLNIYNRCRASFIKKLAGLDVSMTLFIAGHSLGGALSVLSLPDVVKSTPFKRPVLYNIGCPRVGDNDFVQAYDALPGSKTFRVVNTSDLATSVPLPVPIPLILSGYYSHVGIPVDFTFQGNDMGLNHNPATYIKALGG